MDKMGSLRGFLVSVDCGSDGLYQGRISHVDTEEMTLERATVNGIPQKSAVKVQSCKIKDAKVYQRDENASPGSMRNVDHLRGYLVSVDCGSAGLYQGQIYSVNVDTKELTLEKATCDGIPLGPQRHATLSATKIEDLKVYRTTTMLTPPSLLMPKFPRQSQPSVQTRNGPPRNDATPGGALGPCGVPEEDRERGYRRYTNDKTELNEPIDRKLMETEFDFEFNLALFNKDSKEQVTK